MLTANKSYGFSGGAVQRIAPTFEYEGNMKDQLITCFESESAEDTFLIGRQLGEKASPGEIYLLSGDLGAGKTVFAKGFASGLQVEDDVTSPTFTIIREYEGGRIPFAHFDAYRIDDPDEMYELGYEDYFFGNWVCLIEWPEMIEELIPDEACRINISRDLARGMDHRDIKIERR